MFHRITTLRVDLQEKEPPKSVDSVDAADRPSALAHVSAGWLEWMSGVDKMPVFGGSRLYWICNSPDDHSGIRRFVLPNRGTRNFNFLITGATIYQPEPGTLQELIPTMTQGILAIVSSLTEEGILVDIGNRRRSYCHFHYIEVRDIVSALQLLEPSVAAELISETLRRLHFVPDRYNWVHPSFYSDVLGVQAGTSTLMLDDLLLAKPQEGDQDEETLRLPYIVKDLLIWKAVISRWGVHVSDILSARHQPSVASALGGGRGPSNKDGDEVFAAANAYLTSRHKWLATYHQIKSELRDVRQMVTGQYRYHKSLRAPIKTEGVKFPHKSFLDDLDMTIESLLVTTDNELEHQELFDTLRGTHLSQKADFVLSRQNLDLQDRLVGLTWALLFLTFLIGLLTAVLALESPSLRVWVSKLLSF